MNIETYFDWEKAVKIIKKTLKKHPNLTAIAGMGGDWGSTSGIIFEEGQPTNGYYTYLGSNRDFCFMQIWDGEKLLRIDPCYKIGEGKAVYYWMEPALNLLGIPLKIEKCPDI